MPDCGSNSCLHATNKTGQRTNGRCKCDDCPDCGRVIRPKHGFVKHYDWCETPNWVPDHKKVVALDIEKIAELLPEEASSFMAVPDPEFKR